VGDTMSRLTDEATEAMKCWACSGLGLKGGSPWALKDCQVCLGYGSAAPPRYWLEDAAEALGKVRESDGAPLALTWNEALDAIRELKAELDECIDNRITRK
jgi:hypothetical protein